MDFSELTRLLFEGLKPALENHVGLGVFVCQRSKFDDWLKVEVCRVLAEHGLAPDPERQKAGISVGKWAIEVRTVSTNIPHENVHGKSHSIRKGIETLIRDIWRLTNPGRSTSFPQRGILFVAFPATHDDERWQSVHLGQISSELTRLEYLQFHFDGNIPGVLYFGLCSDHQ